MDNSKEILGRLLEHLKLSANKLSVELGHKNNTKIYHVKNGRNKISSELANQISEKYNISLSWLLTGQGEMLKDSIVKEPELKYNTEAIPVDFTEMNVMFVPLVSKFAYAGYLDNLGDNEYVEDLPKIPFANDVQNRGDYLCFEVKGDSMESDTPDTILEGDILLCRNVKQEYWKSKLHINKWDFVIVHKERGILIKRIIEHNTENHELTLHSLNDYYDDIKVHLKDVQAIFNVVDLRRKRNRR